MEAFEIIRAAMQEFSGVPDEQVHIYISLAEPMISERKFGRLYPQALAYLAAHQMKAGGLGQSAVGGISIGDMSGYSAISISEGDTEHIPSRPFLRKSVDENEGKINQFLQAEARSLASGKTAETLLNEIGNFQKSLVQEKITEGSFAPNAESTIRRKGSSKPLIDTGRMRQSVNYVIKQKGQD